MSRRLGKAFFRDRMTLRLARDLLGCTLVHETPRGTIRGVIYETEAYTETDEATHSFGGRRTKRNEVMFSEGGHLYVYFTYGMHYCANVVSERDGKGCAVLLRAVTITDGIALARKSRGAVSDRNLANGPAKLCQAFGLNKRHNGLDMTDPKSRIYLLPGKRVGRVVRTPRIGISRAKEKLWRFLAV